MPVAPRPEQSLVGNRGERCQIIIFLFFMSIPEQYQINDVRTTKDFANKTFSGYLKIDVFKGLFKAIDNYKVEEACNWTTELIVSCQTDKLYERFIIYACIHINVGNRLLPDRIYKRYKMYIDSNVDNIAAINNQIIRTHLIELTVILCLSNKSKVMAFPKITEIDYTNEILSSKLKANDKNIINASLKPCDAEELRVVINELWYSVRIKNMSMVLYWLKWMAVYEKQLNKNKKQLMCATRNIPGVPVKYHTNYIWIIWDIILRESKTHINATQIGNLYNIYVANYKKSAPIIIIVNAIQYFTAGTYNSTRPLCPNYNILIQATAKVNFIFQKKKSYEVRKLKNVEFKKKMDGKGVADAKQDAVFDIDNFIMNR